MQTGSCMHDEVEESRSCGSCTWAGMGWLASAVAAPSSFILPGGEIWPMVLAWLSYSLLRTTTRLSRLVLLAVRLPCSTLDLTTNILQQLPAYPPAVQCFQLQIAVFPSTPSPVRTPNSYHHRDSTSRPSLQTPAYTTAHPHRWHPMPASTGCCPPAYCRRTPPHQHPAVLKPPSHD
jgi:hypothetical protein